MLSKSALINYFDVLADSYAVNEFASCYTTNYMRRKLINKIENFENKNILDLMSGRGENLNYINIKNFNTKITTVDFSSKMNAVSRLKHSNKNLTQLESDFFEMDYKPKSFDIIICSFGLKTINNEKLDVFSKKIYDLIKPNGEILFLEMVKPKSAFNFKLYKIYLEFIVPKLFGKKFKPLFPYIKNHLNMNALKNKMLNQDLKIVEHKRFFDFFEIIHAKK